MSDLLENLYEEKRLATVSITVVRQDDGISSGSGFFISKDGLLFTASHVVRETDNDNQAVKKIYVSKYGEKKSYVYEAQLVGFNVVTDIAVIKIDAKSEHYLKFGDSRNCEDGELVFTIGNPNGSDPLSISNGVIRDSHFHTTRTVSESIFNTIKIYGGNSGGPVMNSCGEVVSFISYGLNDLGSPENTASGGTSEFIFRNMLKTIINKGNGYELILPFFGISVQSLLPKDVFDFNIPKNRILGSKVSGVATGSPAEDSGILEGDVIQSINGITVGDIKEQLPMTHVTFLDRIGGKVNVKLIRAGSLVSSDVTLEAYFPGFVEEFTEFF